MKNTKPPFSITEQMLSDVIEIGELVGKASIRSKISTNPTLRRTNRIRTIYSSLAIEQNSMDIEQITAVLSGKHVIAPPKDIAEVKNEYEIYECMDTLDPYSTEDLLKAHSIMVRGIENEAGEFRSRPVGVVDSTGKILHFGTLPQYVPQLITELLDWTKTSGIHILIKSCVFHYEFEFIHPFQDGNGRMGRLWQTAILKEWKEVFAWLPVETLIKENQKEYYKVLAVSDSVANSTKFIEFMLSIILNTINEIIETERKVTVKVTLKVTVNQQKIIDAIKSNPKVTQEELAEIVGITRKSVISNMKKLQENGLINRIGADKNGYWKVVE